MTDLTYVTSFEVTAPVRGTEYWVRCTV